jgi:hypothetical protein
MHNTGDGDNIMTTLMMKMEALDGNNQRNF